MEKIYDPKSIESYWSTAWEQAGYFAPSGHGNPYCIMLPPPNVTGSLHMGHGFQHTLMDALTRYHRMCGDNTLWQPGTDHAGIATQMVVEQQLLANNSSRQQVGREAFVDKVWEWKTQSGGMITQQMRRLGSSVDWSKERFTMDAGLSAAVQQAFIQLYEEGLIYRGKRLVNWDPTFRTAISDLEVIATEEMGSLWHIRYPLASGDGYLVVATTRPETILGDVAVAVHPDDQRYQHLIGQHLKLPLTQREIPIIADAYVDPEFGSGCVKITPAHDFNDYALGQRHQLELINIFNPDATLNEQAPENYRGLDRFVARKKIVADLTAADLLETIVPHKLSVPRGERGGAVIEPYLTDQWYVKASVLAEPALAAVKNGQIKFVPENWTKTYFQWLENIQDWCISRQLWWGHRIPAWYDETGRVYVGADEATVRKNYQLSQEITLHQDEDVLDTWFSSALWPFSTLGWPEQTPALQNFYPTSVLITGFDIIFFWVARMVMFGLKFVGQVPFKEVYITGLIRDAEGQKMSKTKGNVLDPIDLIDGISLEQLVAKRTSGLMQPKMAKAIEQATRKQFPQGIAAYGTDALRFTFCALATTGRDIRFDLGRVEGYRNFCNKLWNATRFVLMNVESHDLTAAINTDLSLADYWIQYRLQQTIQAVHQHFTDYRFDLIAQALYEFTWGDYCDWYLELAKTNLADADPKIQYVTRKTLANILEQLLRLMHPLMPYITEAIWQQVAPLAGKQADTIMLQAYPVADSALQTDKDNTLLKMDLLQKVTLAIRNIRSEMQVSPAKTIRVLLRSQHAVLVQQLTSQLSYLKNLVKAENISWLADDETVPPSATAALMDLEIFIPLAGLIDVTAERQRLEREINKFMQELQYTETKLDNQHYVAKAPPEVVAKSQARCDEVRGLIAKLQTQLTQLQSEL